ncbi:uncharacterized protein LOC117298512 [Asterias rubens]|uniref:uncharacterized protein LOC117298512 n=1 Tax=Asterias rubens TaxID=7604 RepID=UPI001454E9E2|nr:uncharacterized protein LOC117298512 [Asterias rubens]
MASQRKFTTMDANANLVSPGNGHKATSQYCSNGSSLINGSESPHPSQDSASSAGTVRVSMGSLARVMTCILAGAIFGLSMEKGRVFEPELIRRQMDFSCLIMLKMFLAAVAVVLVSMTALSVISLTRQRFHIARDNFICRLSAKGVSASAIGGTLLGVGMTFAGACPGAVLVQIGAGVCNAFYTLVGSIIGAMLYGVTERTVSRWTRPNNPPQKVRIDEVIGLPFWMVALPLGVVMALIVYLLEVMVPWKNELSAPNNNDASLVALRSWLPSISGALIGSMQIPIVLAMGQTMGGSGSYCTMAAQFFPSETLARISPYLLRTKYGFNNWWSIAYGCAAIIGAIFSASMSGSLGTTLGVPAHHAFVGGIVMVYGSRLAGGCTSGHGMSGMGTLCLFSFVAVPAMFIGGIGTLAMIKLTGLVN